MQKILVIDDEAPLRKLVIAALRGKGYSILEAEDGAVGIQAARTHLPDLILCDVMMPNLDGYNTLEALRKDPATAVIPIILMTGRPDNAGMRQGMTLGADDYLPKPFAIHELQAAVETRLKKQLALRQQAEKKLADLRSNISLALPHELFTPLSGIIGFAEIISGETGKLQAHEIQEIGQAILVSSKRLYRLVENFLIYAQIELLAADPQKVESLRRSDPIPTRDLAEGCARQRAHQANRDSDLSLDLAPASAALQDEYLKRILDELLDNAFKFSESGTPVNVRSVASANATTIWIADRGRGMTSQQIGNVGAYMQFERKFYEQQGSGLGLTIAKRLAELHGGSLTIESKPGLGTTVTVTLPGGQTQ
jgi:two-component system sensor histidine kinase/response regulator